MLCRLVIFCSTFFASFPALARSHAARTIAYAFCNSNSCSMSPDLLSRASRLLEPCTRRSSFTGSVNGLRLTSCLRWREIGAFRPRADTYSDRASAFGKMALSLMLCSVESIFRDIAAITFDLIHLSKLVGS
jgi:hypothetical protein